MKKKKRIILLGILVCGVFVAYVLWTQVLKSSAVSVSFFDIGQGDSAFIQTSSGIQVLIDGGPNDTILEKLGNAMPWWDTSLDVVIVTHPAQDHMAGILDVLKKYRVATILWNGIDKDTALYRAWLEALEEEKQQGASVVIAKAPERIWLGSKCQFLDILHPFDDIVAKNFGDDNDTSIVARLETCGHSSVLFTGDITSKGEKSILGKGFFIDTDVLKVGHHGSKTSSTLEFVQAVSPDVAVISVGQHNRYGHPHKETLETFARYGIQVMRTDKEGDITLHF